MQFLNEIREHLKSYETEASEEIHKFIDWLHTKYQPPGAPVVSPPETSYVQSTPTFIPAADNAGDSVAASDGVVAAVPAVELDSVDVASQVENIPTPVDPVPPAIEG
jgi:hypothetical protein